MSESGRIVRVREVMNAGFDLVDGMSTVAQALDAMRHVDTRALIVKKRHDDDEYGMVLLSDIVRQVLAQDRAPERVNVYEIMTKPVLAVHPEMDIRYCARLFERFELSLAPVIEARKVIGIVTATDLVMRGLRR